MCSPLYAIALLLLDTQTAPKRRTVRAVGSSVVMKSLIVMSLSLISLGIDNRWSLGLPIALGLVVCVIAIRIMQLQHYHDTSLSKFMN